MEPALPPPRAAIAPMVPREANPHLWAGAEGTNTAAPSIIRGGTRDSRDSAIGRSFIDGSLPILHTRHAGTLARASAGKRSPATAMAVSIHSVRRCRLPQSATPTALIGDADLGRFDAQGGGQRDLVVLLVEQDLANVFRGGNLAQLVALPDAPAIHVPCT